MFKCHRCAEGTTVHRFDRICDFETPILTDQSIALSWGSEPRPAPEPHPHAVTDTEHTMAHLNEQSYVPPSNRFAERAHREISDAQRHVASVFKGNPDRPGLNPRGYNYLGPGNPMDGRPPTNPLDALAHAHDLDGWAAALFPTTSKTDSTCGVECIHTHIVRGAYIRATIASQNTSMQDTIRDNENP